MGILAFDFAGEEEVKEEVAPMGLKGCLREGIFPKCWGSLRWGPVATFLHGIISTDRLTSLPVPYGCPRKKTQSGKFSCAPHLTQLSSPNCNYLSANSLLKEEAVREDWGLGKGRKWTGWRCGKDCNQSSKPWQLWERRRCGWKTQWPEEEVEMRIKWLVTARQW